MNSVQVDRVGELLKMAIATDPEANAIARSLHESSAIRSRDLVTQITAPASLISRCELDAGECDGVRIAAGSRIHVAYRSDGFTPPRPSRPSPHGASQINIPAVDARGRRAHIHAQILRSRRRSFRDGASGYRTLRRLLHAAVTDVGPDVARTMFLRAELEYWLTRCEPAMLQSIRQEQAGIGWAHIDRYTFVCSRQHYHALYALLILLGYQSKEMRRSTSASVVVFEADGAPSQTIVVEVDCALAEFDCVRRGLELSPTLFGRAQLWSALHGDSVFEGGLSRVTATYDCQQLCRLIATSGHVAHDLRRGPHWLEVVAPGRRLAVAPHRVDALEQQGLIGCDDAEHLRIHGAVSAHLHGIERRAPGAQWSLPRLFDGLDAILQEPATIPPTIKTRHRLRRRAPSMRGAQ